MTPNNPEPTKLTKALPGLPSRLFGLLLCTASLLLMALSLAGFAGGLNWLLDLSNHFKPLYALLQIPLLLLLLLLRRRGWALFTGLGLLLNLCLLVPFYWPRAATSTSGSPFRLVQLNVCAPAKDYGRTSAYLLREDPDLIALEECADRCIAHLQRDGVWERYPYRFRKTPQRHRLVVLSKTPLRPLPLTLVADPAVALLESAWADQPVSVLVLHSTRPSSGASYHRTQIHQFAQIAALVRATTGPFVLLGDLNTTPWGYSFRKLLADSDLHNSMEGFGIQPSFPVFVPRYPQWLTPPVFPIDQVLVSKHFQVLRRKTGPALDSDHLPLSVEIALEPD